jgi:hypothetical protein
MEHISEQLKTGKFKAFLSFLDRSWFKFGVLFLLTVLTISILDSLHQFTNEYAGNMFTSPRFNLEKDREKRLYESEIFDRKIKCQGMVEEFKKRYNNVTGGSYNNILNTCDIEYRDGISKESSPMEFMSDN